MLGFRFGKLASAHLPVPADPVNTVAFLTKHIGGPAKPVPDGRFSPGLPPHLLGGEAPYLSWSSSHAAMDLRSGNLTWSNAEIWSLDFSREENEYNLYSIREDDQHGNYVTEPCPRAHPCLVPHEKGDPMFAVTRIHQNVTSFKKECA